MTVNLLLIRERDIYILNGPHFSSRATEGVCLDGRTDVHKNGEYTSRSLVAVDGAAPSVERIVPRFWNTDGTFLEH